MTGLELTPQQRAIVDFPLDRPLRVEAGAGTGKTTTIALRLGEAVRSGTLEPEQALGITFTNKATEELSARLRFILPDQTTTGRHVQVSTYHGFAWSIITEFGAYVGIERDSRIIGAGYVRQIILDALATTDGLESLDLTHLPGQMNAAASLANQLGANLVTPGELVAAAPEAVDDVWRKRIELTKVLEAYAARKRELRAVDYSDMVGAAARIVSEYPLVAERIRSRYRLVILDEYQDTDPGQRELLRTIFGNGFPVTAVGDLDQTIYVWRGASLANFAAFPEHFPNRDGTDAATLPLSLNRRSGQLILDVADALRAEIHGTDPANPLLAVPGTEPGTVRLDYYARTTTEAVAIAEEIKRLHDEEGVVWADMAVLFRTNSRIALVRDAIESLEIPHEVAALGGLLAVPEVADLRAWLAVVDDPEATASLVRILLGGRYRLGIGDVAPLAAWTRRQNRRSEDEELAWPLLEAIDRIEDVEGLSSEARRRLEEFSAEYRGLLTAAQTLSLVELSRLVLDVTGTWLDIDARQPSGALSARLNLFRFLDLAEEWSPLEGRPSLGAFLGYLSTLEEETSSDDLDTARLGNADAVALLTIHRSKGLEWDTVFVPALTQGVFPSTARGGYDNPLVKATSVPYELRPDADHLPILTGDVKADRETLRAAHVSQELRTAYVAVTRARARCYLSGAHYTADGKRARSPSVIYTTARAVPGVEIGTEEAAGEPPAGAPRPPSGPAPDPVFADGWLEAMRSTAVAPATVDRIREAAGVAPDAYDAAVDQFRLQLEGLPDPPEIDPSTAATSVSVTGLVTMAQCPRRYYWAEIDRLPRRPSHSLRRGTEVHRRIELYHRGQMPLEDLDAAEYDVGPGDAPVEADGATAGNAFDAFTGSEYARRSPIFVETPIDIALPTGRARGRIDAVYPLADGGWEIVDFKSGRNHGDPARQVQLDAYAIAAMDGVLGRPPSRLLASFVFLGGGRVEVESVTVDEGYLGDARNRVTELLGAIGHSKDRESFATTTGEHCGGCDFLSHCESGKAWVGQKH